MCVGMLRCFSCVQHCVILWTVACQDPLSMEFFRQEYWHGLLCPSPGELLNPRSNMRVLHLLHGQVFFFFFFNHWLYGEALHSSSVSQFSCSVVSDSLRPHESQRARPPCPTPIPEFTQTHVHRVSDAIQPSHPLSSPSPPALNPSQHQSLFQ